MLGAMPAVRLGAPTERRSLRTACCRRQIPQAGLPSPESKNGGFAAAVHKS